MITHGTTARALGHEAVSVDTALPARHRMRCAREGLHFDIVCASPPCAVWSNARWMDVGKLRKSTGGMWTRETLPSWKGYTEPGYCRAGRGTQSLGIAELEGVHTAWARSAACGPDARDTALPETDFYCIENPWLSRMRDYILDLPCVCVGHCSYGDTSTRAIASAPGCWQSLSPMRSRATKKRGGGRAKVRLLKLLSSLGTPRPPITDTAHPPALQMHNWHGSLRCLPEATRRSGHQALSRCFVWLQAHPSPSLRR
jgi:hypothetical protein